MGTAAGYAEADPARRDVNVRATGQRHRRSAVLADRRRPRTPNPTTHSVDIEPFHGDENLLDVEPVLGPVEDHLAHDEVLRTEDRDRGVAEVDAPNAVGHRVVYFVVREEQVDRRGPPLDAHLSVGLDAAAGSIDASNPSGSSACVTSVCASGFTNTLQSMSMVARGLRVVRQRDRAAECVRDCTFGQGDVDGNQLVGKPELRHRARSKAVGTRAGDVHGRGSGRQGRAGHAARAPRCAVVAPIHGTTASTLSPGAEPRAPGGLDRPSLLAQQRGQDRRETRSPASRSASSARVPLHRIGYHHRRTRAPSGGPHGLSIERLERATSRPGENGVVEDPERREGARPRPELGDRRFPDLETALGLRHDVGHSGKSTHYGGGV